jgi:hypothetical protein
MEHPTAALFRLFSFLSANLLVASASAADVHGYRPRLPSSVLELGAELPHLGPQFLELGTEPADFGADSFPLGTGLSRFRSVFAALRLLRADSLHLGTGLSAFRSDFATLSQLAFEALGHFVQAGGPQMINRHFNVPTLVLRLLAPPRLVRLGTTGPAWASGIRLSRARSTLQSWLFLELAFNPLDPALDLGGFLFPAVATELLELGHQSVVLPAQFSPRLRPGAIADVPTLGRLISLATDLAIDHLAFTGLPFVGSGVLRLRAGRIRRSRLAVSGTAGDCSTTQQDGQGEQKRC